jgi:hypothetical protein
MAHAVAGAPTPATQASHRLNARRAPQRYPTFSMRFSGGGATGECAPI